MEALDKTKPSDYSFLVKYLRTLLSYLKTKGKHILLHCGIPGNERLDEIAKDATNIGPI